MKIKSLARLMGFCVTTLLASNVYAEEQGNFESCKPISSVELGELEQQEINEVTRQSLIELSQKYQNILNNPQKVESIIGKETKEKLENITTEVISGKTNNSSILNAQALSKDVERVLSELDYQKALETLQDTMSSEEYKKLTELLTNAKKEKDIDAQKDLGDLANAKLYIFVSWSMGETTLKELFKLTAREPNISLIFRGVLPNENITQGTKRIHKLLINNEKKEKENISFSDMSEQEIKDYLTRQQLKNKAQEFILPPNIRIDPVAFRDFAITSVPAMVLFNNNDERKTCFLVEKMGSPTNVCYLNRATGISNPNFLYEKARSGFLGNLGNYGSLLDIAEPDLIDVMKQKAMSIDWNEKKKKALNNFFVSRKDHNLNYPLGYAMYNRVRFINPSIVSPVDIKDHFGKVLVPKGSTISPFDVAPFNNILIIFNPAREIELQKINDYLSSRNIKMNDSRVMLIATEIPTNDKENGWEFYKKLVHKLEKHVYLLNSEIKESFNVQVTPTVVTGSKKEKLIKLEELGDIMSRTEEIVGSSDNFVGENVEFRKELSPSFFLNPNTYANGEIDPDETDIHQLSTELDSDNGNELLQYDRFVDPDEEKRKKLKEEIEQEKEIKRNKEKRRGH